LSRRDRFMEPGWNMNASTGERPAIRFQAMMGAVRAGGTALAIAAFAIGAAAQKPQAPLNTLSELGAALRACWVPPPIDQSHPGMQITVQMSFKRNGELFGRPKITFETAGASDDERLAYRMAVAGMLQRWAPSPFTDALGGAVAGRPFTVRLLDDRKLKQAESAENTADAFGNERLPSARQSEIGRRRRLRGGK
jgi:hypothetical protein